jgi:hypothetical protein
MPVLVDAGAGHGAAREEGSTAAPAVGPSRIPSRTRWDPAPPARPRPRGRRGRSSSCGAEEPMPRLASAGREREGSWGGVAATAPASGCASATRGRPPSRGREVGEGGGWTEEPEDDDIF